MLCLLNLIKPINAFMVQVLYSILYETTSESIQTFFFRFVHWFIDFMDLIDLFAISLHAVTLNNQDIFGNGLKIKLLKNLSKVNV